VNGAKLYGKTSCGQYEIALTMLMPRSPESVKVLVSNECQLICEGLAAIIARQPGFMVCGHTTDVAEVFHLLSSTTPDISIVGIGLDNTSGIDIITRILARRPHVRILVLSSCDESVYAERALRAGALGFLHQNQPADQILTALMTISQDNVYLSEVMNRRILQRAIGRISGDTDDTPIDGLSNRELQVFQFIGQGLDTRQIGERLHLSHKTVETYRWRIKEKLGLDSAAELIWRAVKWIGKKQ
jgi:DNA-binding NarL/FixJ family response regulator